MNFSSEAAAVDFSPDLADGFEFVKSSGRGRAARKSDVAPTPRFDDDMTEEQTLTLLLRYFSVTGDLGAVASSLLQTFGGLKALLWVSSKRLQPFSTLDETVGPVLRLIAHVVTLVTSTAVTRQPLLDNSAALMSYLRYSTAVTHSETIRVLYLDRSNHLIHDSFVSQGGRLAALTSLREVGRQACVLSARSLIFAHLRPTHDDPPDQEDLELFARLGDLCRVLQVCHSQHLLIGRTGFQSLMETAA